MLCDQSPDARYSLMSILHTILSVASLGLNGAFRIDRIFNSGNAVFQIAAGVSIVVGLLISGAHVLPRCIDPIDAAPSNSHSVMYLLLLSVVEECLASAPMLMVMYNANLNDKEFLDYATISVNLLVLLRVLILMTRVYPKSDTNVKANIGAVNPHIVTVTSFSVHVTKTTGTSICTSICSRLVWVMHILATVYWGIVRILLFQQDPSYELQITNVVLVSMYYITPVVAILCAGAGSSFNM